MHSGRASSQAPPRTRYIMGRRSCGPATASPYWSGRTCTPATIPATIRSSASPILSIVARTPEGKAGAADGALGEYLSALSVDQPGDLLALLTATLQGRRPLPPSWKHADETQIPKVAGALLATQYQPFAYGCMLRYRTSNCAREVATDFEIPAGPRNCKPSPYFRLNSDVHGGWHHS